MGVKDSKVKYSLLERNSISRRGSTVSLNSIESRRERIQNYSLIWVDSNIDENDPEYISSVMQLRCIVHNVIFFKELIQFTKYLNSMTDEKIFLLTSGGLGQNLVPKIHNVSQFDSIYIFCQNKQWHEQWAAQWSKVRGVFISMEPIYDSLRKVVREYDQYQISMSIISQKAMAALVDSDSWQFNTLDPCFMYSMLFKGILLETQEDDSNALNQFVTYCRTKGISEQQLNYFQNHYSKKSAIWWYTYESFLYELLNYALRTLDREAMTKMGFFIRSLYQQITKLYKTQSNASKKKLSVYRCQVFTKENFEQLHNANDGLLSFNNFVSANREKQVTLQSIEHQLQINEDHIGVIFTMTIDKTKLSGSDTLFAFICDYSGIEAEQEVLFPMHTVFHIDTISQTHNNTRLWEISMTLRDNSDPQISALIQSMNREIDECGWYRVCKLMLEIGDYDEAEKLYEELLENSTSMNDKQRIYEHLGSVKILQGKYREAVKFYEESLAIRLKKFDKSHPSLARAYDCVALAHKHLCNYSTAIEFYEKANRVREHSPDAISADAVCTYDNIGELYESIEEYGKAFEFFEKAHKINIKIFSSNHLLSATYYRNIGRVYFKMGDTQQALEFYEKAHKIEENHVPQNRSALAESYSNMGYIYNYNGDYSKALEYYQKSYEVLKISYGENHSKLAAACNNIGEVHQNMGNYQEAIEFHTKAYTIQSVNIVSYHPDFVQTYNCLAKVYRNVKDYTKALEYFEKCFEICQEMFSDLNPKLAITYTDMGDIHRLMGDNEKALSLHQKALDIQQQVICQPLERAVTYINTGETYREMKEYSMALDYYEKALGIYEIKLPKNHPDIAGIYYNMAKLYLSTEQSNMAMKTIEQAIKIAEKKLPSTHPRLLEYREFSKTFE